MEPAKGQWCLAAGKITIGLASHCGSSPMGSRPRRGGVHLPTENGPHYLLPYCKVQNMLRKQRNSTRDKCYWHLHLTRTEWNKSITIMIKMLQLLCKWRHATTTFDFQLFFNQTIIPELMPCLVLKGLQGRTFRDCQRRIFWRFFLFLLPNQQH